MDIKRPAANTFKLFLVKPAASSNPVNFGQVSAPPQPDYIETVTFLANDKGEQLTAKLPAVGAEHKYTYTIPADMKASFFFSHSGHFSLKPSYDVGPIDHSSTGEGSARAHGETANASNTDTDWETRVPHPAGHQRTVTWTIIYLGFGKPYEPYKIEINRIS